jgi:hypothetical protein
VFKYSLFLIASIVLFTGCEDNICCNADREDVKLLGDPTTQIDPEIPSVNPEVPVLKKPTAVITPGACEDHARWFSCLDSKDNDSIDPIPDVGITETNIQKCEWTIKVYGFGDNPSLLSEYDTYAIYYEDGTLDPSSTVENELRWIGHDGGYKIIELVVVDDDNQSSAPVIKKFDYTIGDCGDLVDP